MRHLKINNIVSGVVVGGLAGMVWPLPSWKFFGVIVSWAVLSAIAQSIDEVRGICRTARLAADTRGANQ